MCENPEKQTYHLWMAAASTLAYFDEEGRDVFHELSHLYSNYSESKSNELFDRMLKSRQNGVGPITYKKLSEFGFEQKDETNAASPAIYIERLLREQVLSQMGISFKELNDEGKLCFNANIFSDYILERDKLLIYEGKMFYKYSAGVWLHFPDYKLVRKIRDMIQAVQKNIYRSWIGNDAVEMLKIAVPEAQEMDIQKYLVNLANGMLNISTQELLGHDPGYLSTVQIPISYDPHAKCERFKQFMDEIMDGDLERIAVIQEIAGYLLTAETLIHKAFFLHGEGSNGKSLLLEVLTMLIGHENVSNLTLQDLDNSFRRSSLIGKTVNIATENEINIKGFNSQYFKAIVSGDRILVEK